MSPGNGSSGNRATSAVASRARGSFGGRAAGETREARQQGAAPASSARPPAPKACSAGKGWRTDAKREPDPILFQTYFKSVGPRTYAAQLKRAVNGNHYLVFTEGKRDRVTDELRKIGLYVYSEDFASFFRMLKQTAEYVKAHPLPPDVAQRRARYWQRQKGRLKQ
jgi:hypothetical protein